MRFLCDEGVERQVVERLRRDGHSVGYVAEMSPGISDEEVLGLAGREGAILVSADKDFGELVFRVGRVTSGVVLMRLHGLFPDEKAAIVSRAIGRYGQEMVDAFAVVDKDKVRIRRAT